ncbi:MAG TPA: sulfotransferase [Thermomicrobiales bacterium]|nr:sulfotransferase [Thermomicrobiales bacterium]
MAVETPVKVLYIAGFERSGSTLLTKVAGELEHTFAAAELRGIWHRSFQTNQECGCGQGFRECDLWQEIIADAYGGYDNVDWQRMIDLRPKRRHTPLLLMPGSQPVIARMFREYIATLDQLYRSIATVTDSRVIVDSSKTPLYAAVLGLAPSVDLRVLLLIRNPHGVQSSNLRRARDGDRMLGTLDTYSVSRSLLEWDALHATQELLGLRQRKRYMRMRYEDFVADPVASIEQIKQFLDEPDIGIPRFKDGTVYLSPNHTVCGNRNRIETGAVPLRLDERWRTDLDADTRTLVRRLTLPLLHRYGYAG